MASTIISRADAKAQGLKRYFTGRPCKHGHIAERLVSVRTCLGCKPDPDKERARMRAQYARNPATHKARKRLYLDANRELARESSRRWKARNRERDLETAREWKAKNPDAGALWHKNNPEKSRENVRRRRARKMGAPGSHTAADVAALLVVQKHRCAHPGCGADLRKVGRHLDHIIPLALGGSNDRRNIQFLCVFHNLSKGSRDPIVFAQMQGRLL